MAFQPVANGLRLGSLVELHDLPEGAVERASNGDKGQLVGYVREVDKFEVMLINGATVQVGAEQMRVPAELKKSGADETSFDMLIGPRTPDPALAEELSTCLFEKGFCVLRLCQSAEDVESALEVVRGAGDEGRLGRLPQEVEEGYLGSGNRGKVIWLDPDEPDMLFHEILDANDKNLSRLATIFQPFSEDALGRIIEERTPALVSLSLQDEEEDDYPFPMADDKTLGDFLGSWRRGLVRAVHFMGPETCDVMLELKDGNKAAALPGKQDTVGLTAAPNTILLFRPDCYAYSCASETEALTMMTSFMSVTPQFTLTSWEGDVELLSTIVGGPPPPRWNECINVMNCNTRLGANWDEPEMMAAGLQGGCDTVTEIPYSRFDVNFYFCEDPDEVLFGPPRTIQRHTSFVEAVDLFDNKYFEIATAEATAMDPLQRQVLEVGGACLYQQGISKKVSNRSSHHGGCSVGLDKADFPTLGIDNGPSAGNNALAIVANRFSFTFNLKGPNYICDTACSASLTATHLAKLMLMERVYDPLDFHIAIGTHLCLSPSPWIGCSMSHMVSPQGRCFTFNATANGYLRGEGTSGQFLKYGPEVKDRDAIYRASMCGQDGRSASLTAPNGPAQEEIISKAIKEANMTPPESTVWECHGTGTSLGDPIEVGAVRKIQVRMPRLEPLMLTSNKTNIGHLEGGAAMGGICKCVLQCKYGRCLPTIHLRTLNPHLEHEAFDAIFQTEGASYHYNQGHSQVSSFGFGGSNGHGVFWGGKNDALRDHEKLILTRIKRLAPAEVRVTGKNPDEWEADFPDPQSCKRGAKFKIELDAEDPRDKAAVWEKVDEDEDGEDADAYYAVTGNFNEWGEDRMTPGDVAGLHTIAVDIPESGTLEFRFMQDGDPDMVICPMTPACTRRTEAILGPDKGLTNKWIIQGPPDREVRIELFVSRRTRSVMWLVEKDM